MSPLNASFQQRARWLKIAGRLSGLTAVILGGWSLWLAFSTENMPDQIEALNERQNESAIESDDLPEVLRPTPKRVRSAVQITDVAADTGHEEPVEIESARFVSTKETPSDVVAVASFSAEASDDSAGNSSASAATASAAWLTGEIEDTTAESEPAVDAVVRPWKRTTKSLKSMMRSPRSVPSR
jgi:hypothetical protein